MFGLARCLGVARGGDGGGAAVVVAFAVVDRVDGEIDKAVIVLGLLQPAVEPRVKRLDGEQLDPDRAVGLAVDDGDRRFIRVIR